MIESVNIFSLGAAAHIPYKENPVQNLWVSMSDPEDNSKVNKLKTKLRQRGIPCFTQYFRDWSDEDTEPYILANINDQGPQVSHINNIISFLEPYVASDTPYRLGVNCYAGISRSTAVGIIAWVMQGKSPEEALQSILDVRAIAWPNLRMLKFASVRLGVDILSPVEKWKNELKGIIAYEL